MGLLSETLIADLADAEKIAEDEDFDSGKYKTLHMKNIMPEFFDTLFFILKDKQSRFKSYTACKLVYQSSDVGPRIYQFTDEFIKLLANLDPASVEEVANDIVELDETFQQYAAIGIAVAPTEYLTDLRKQCKSAIARNKTILLRINL